MFNDIPISGEEAEVIACANFGNLRAYDGENFTVKLTLAQISELERLVVGYTEALAMYNALGAGKQATLDILNSAWERIANARAI